MLIDYLNPTGTPLTALGSAPNANGLITMAVDPSTGALFFKSAGYNCSVGFIYTEGCANAGGVDGVAQSVKGNNLTWII